MTILDHSEIRAAIEDALVHSLYVKSGYETAIAHIATGNVCKLLEEKTNEAICEAHARDAEQRLHPSAIPPATPINDEYSQTAAQQLRSEAYRIAISSLNGRNVADSTLHGLASDIADRIIDGHPQTSRTEVLSVKIAPDTSDFQRIIDEIFGRTEWRREGWNDAKSVMIGHLTKEIKALGVARARLSDENVLEGFTRAELGQVRQFIASFQFNPEKP